MEFPVNGGVYLDFLNCDIPQKTKELIAAFGIIAIRENSRTNLSDKNSHYCVKLP